MAAKDHRGGFNFFDLNTGLQYGSAEFELEAEEVARRYPRSFRGLVAAALLRRVPARLHPCARLMPLGDYLDRGGYTQEFKRSSVVLLATAVWSGAPRGHLGDAGRTFIAFFMSHDPGGLGGHRVAWKTVADGSRSYVRRALAEIGPRWHETARPPLAMRSPAST